LGGKPYRLRIDSIGIRKKPIGREIDVTGSRKIETSSTPIRTIGKTECLMNRREKMARRMKQWGGCCPEGKNLPERGRSGSVSHKKGMTCNKEN